MENKITFSENIDTLETIRKFLENNGIKETPEEAYERIKQGKKSWYALIKKGTISLANNESDEKLIENLKNEIKITNKKALELIKNIKKDLLPLITTEIKNKPIKQIEQPPQKKVKNNEVKKSDTYREPIE